MSDSDISKFYGSTNTTKNVLSKNLEIDWMSFPGFHPGRYQKNGPCFVYVDAKHESEHSVNSGLVFS